MIFVVFENNYGEQFIEYGQDKDLALQNLQQVVGDSIDFSEIMFFEAQPVVFEKTVKSRFYNC